MRILTVLLFTTCLAAPAFAQQMPATPPTIAGTTATTSTPAAMVNGKYQIGYDGRGDYSKNSKPDKTAPSTTATTTSTGPAPVQPTITTPAAPSMRSDTSLTSDSSKAKAAAAASAPATTTAPAPKPAAATTNNGPMVLIGGQIQKQ